MELTSIKLNPNKNINDAAVIAIAQNCPKLEKLEIHININITYKCLLALSEQRLPSKELNMPTIPNIPSADIAVRCSHAFSRNRNINTYNLLRCNLCWYYNHTLYDRTD